MIRVFHLIDHDSNFQSERAASYLSRDLGEGFSATIRTIGRGGDFRNGAAAAMELRRMRGEGIDILHTWSATALTAAAVAGWGRVVFSPPPQLRRRQVNWVRAVQHYREVHVICPSATMRRVCVENGVPLDHCHLIRPGVEFGKIRRRRDGALREALGFRETDYVMLAAGESTKAASHRDALWAAGILNVLDPKYKLLIWGRGGEVPALQRFAGDLHQADLLHVAESRLGRKIELEELMPATDAVLVPARGPVATLPVCIAMAAGLPIIADVTYTLSEILEDRHTAVLVSKRSPKQMAQRVLDLAGDSSLQWAITDMARTEAYEFFTLSRFLTQYRAIYRQIAGGLKVEVPEQAAGAGLRFHGRV